MLSLLSCLWSYLLQGTAAGFTFGKERTCELLLLFCDNLACNTRLAASSLLSCTHHKLYVYIKAGFYPTEELKI